jgi:amidase
MPIRIPTEEDLLRLAEDNYFELSENELEQFQELLPRLFADFEVLNRIPLPATPLKYRDRDAGYKPPGSEDPFNAIVRRCILKGAASGKLAGKRFGLKNNICVAGMPMTCASLVLEGYTADTDATIVTWLLDAGAEIVATLNLDNFAFSGAGDTSAFGPTLNPHNTGHLAGGSSGGSAAALYYDDIDMTIGGDQGGSIRIPASFCGVVGHKPTHGLVPYTGIVGIDNTFDHTGPMTRTVYDAALLLEVIAGKDPLDPRQGEVPVQDYTGALTAGASGLRIGVLTEGFGLPESNADVDHKVRQAANRLAELGASVDDVSVPWHAKANAVVWGLIAEGATGLLQSSGTGRHFEAQYNTGLARALGQGLRAQANDLPPTVKLVLLVGSYMTEKYSSVMYAKAQNMRRELRAAYDDALSRYDLLLMPTTPMPAHRNDAGGDPHAVINHGWDMLANTAPFDMSGHPAISVPCGKASDGLPIGMMLVGRHFDDATVLRAAHAFEQSADWETL